MKGAEDLRFGGIGGLSEVLGWTDVQKQTSKSEGFLGGGFTIIKAVSFYKCCVSSVTGFIVALKPLKVLQTGPSIVQKTIDEQPPGAFQKLRAYREQPSFDIKNAI